MKTILINALASDVTINAVEAMGEMSLLCECAFISFVYNKIPSDLLNSIAFRKNKNKNKKYNSRNQ